MALRTGNDVIKGRSLHYTFDSGDTIFTRYAFSNSLWEPLMFLWEANLLYMESVNRYESLYPKDFLNIVDEVEGSLDPSLMNYVHVRSDQNPETLLMMRIYGGDRNSEHFMLPWQSIIQKRELTSSLFNLTLREQSESYEIGKWIVNLDTLKNQKASASEKLYRNRNSNLLRAPELVSDLWLYSFAKHTQDEASFYALTVDVRVLELARIKVGVFEVEEIVDPVLRTKDGSPLVYYVMRTDREHLMDTISRRLKSIYNLDVEIEIEKELLTFSARAKSR